MLNRRYIIIIDNKKEIEYQSYKKVMEELRAMTVDTSPYKINILMQCLENDHDTMITDREKIINYIQENRLFETTHYTMINISLVEYAKTKWYNIILHPKTTEKTQDHYYHKTNRSNLGNIMKHGLKATIKSQHDKFQRKYGTPRTYFFKSIEDAEWYSQPGLIGDTIILKVDLTGITKYTDKQFEDDIAIYTEQDIEPERITIM